MGLGQQSLPCFLSFSGDSNGELGLRTMSLEQCYSKQGSLASSNKTTLELVRSAFGSGPRESMFSTSRRFLSMSLGCEHTSESPGELVKTQTAESTPRVSDWAGLGQDRRTCSLNKISGDADVAGLWSTPRSALVWRRCGDLDCFWIWCKGGCLRH